MDEHNTGISKEQRIGELIAHWERTLGSYVLGSNGNVPIKLPEPDCWVNPNMQVRQRLEQWMRVNDYEKLGVGTRLASDVFSLHLKYKSKGQNGVINFKGGDWELAVIDSLVKSGFVVGVLVQHTQYAVNWTVEHWAQALDKNPQLYQYLHPIIRAQPDCMHAAIRADCMNLKHVPAKMRTDVRVAQWALDAPGCGVSEFESLYDILPKALKDDIKTLVLWQQRGFISKSRSERFLGTQCERLHFIAKQKKLSSVWEALRWMGAKGEGNAIGVVVKEHQKSSAPEAVSASAQEQAVQSKKTLRL